MINPAVFLCYPFSFEKVCQIFPPTVRETITNPKFGTYQKIFTISEDNLRDNKKADGSVLTPLEFLLSCSFQSESFKLLAMEAFEFFTHEKVTFLFNEKIIVFGDLEEELKKVNNVTELRMLNENNYLAFQNAIRISIGLKELEPEIIDPDEDPRITAIKRKARERDRIKARQSTKSGIQLSTCLTAICCMGIGITPLNIGELSYASIGVIMNMMQEKEKYDIDVRSLLAGADSKKVKPKYWIRNND